MPEFMSSRLASFCGTSEKLGRRRCPLALKKAQEHLSELVNSIRFPFISPPNSFSFSLKSSLHAQRQRYRIPSSRSAGRNISAPPSSLRTGCSVSGEKAVMPQLYLLAAEIGHLCPTAQTIHFCPPKKYTSAPIQGRRSIRGTTLTLPQCGISRPLNAGNIRSGHPGKARKRLPLSGTRPLAPSGPSLRCPAPALFVKAN